MHFSGDPGQCNFWVNLSREKRKVDFLKGTLSVRMLTKKIVQVRIKITQSCKLYQSIPCVQENQKNFYALHFRHFGKPSISSRFAIFKLKLFKFKQFRIKNYESAGNRMYFKESKVKRTEVFLVLWVTRNALVQLAALCDVYLHLQID